MKKQLNRIEFVYCYLFLSLGVLSWKSFANPIKIDGPVLKGYQDRFISEDRDFPFETLEFALQHLLREFDLNAIIHPNHPGTSLFFVPNWLVFSRSDFKGEEGSFVYEINIGGYLNTKERRGSIKDRYYLETKLLLPLEAYLHQKMHELGLHFPIKLEILNFGYDSEEQLGLIKIIEKKALKNPYVLIRKTKQWERCVGKNRRLRNQNRLVWFPATLEQLVGDQSPKSNRTGFEADLSKIQINPFVSGQKTPRYF